MLCYFIMRRTAVQPHKGTVLHILRTERSTIMPMYEQLPKDPVMLLSFVNTQLRDNYASFAAFAEAYPADADTVVASLRTIDYIYDPKRNQFV